MGLRLSNLPVNEVVGDRLFLSFVASFATIIFTWAVAFPIGVYSANISTAGPTTGSPSLASWDSRRPTFCWRSYCSMSPMFTGTSIGGLMDPEYIDAEMSWVVCVDSRTPVDSVVVIGTSGTAGDSLAARQSVG